MSISAIIHNTFLPYLGQNKKENNKIRKEYSKKLQIQSFCPHLKVTKVSLITERHVLSPNLVQVTSPLLVLHASENDLNEKHICITKCQVFYPN